MADYVQNFSDEIILCGHCGRRLFIIGNFEKPYCEKCGHGGKEEPTIYVRGDLYAELQMKLTDVRTELDQYKQKGW